MAAGRSRSSAAPTFGPCRTAKSATMSIKADARKRSTVLTCVRCRMTTPATGTTWMFANKVAASVRPTAARRPPIPHENPAGDNSGRREVYSGPDARPMPHVQGGNDSGPSNSRGYGSGGAAPNGGSGPSNASGGGTAPSGGGAPVYVGPSGGGHSAGSGAGPSSGGGSSAPSGGGGSSSAPSGNGGGGHSSSSGSSAPRSSFSGASSTRSGGNSHESTHKH